MRISFSLLGPLSVADESGPIVIRGTQRRTLLATLLLHAGEPVPAQALADLLWGEDTDPDNMMPLYNQITRLRQALGDNDRVRAVAPGYTIHVEPDELDLRVFDQECAAGRARLAARAWTDASRHFSAALALWRGRPLADIPALADDVRVRELEETYVQALQGRIEAELNLGRHHDLIDELSSLIREHPRNETLHRQLILALHRAGRTDEATAGYDAYENALLDELGLEPGAELRELRAAVDRDDPALALRQNPDAPRQLPADTRLFTGRDDEVAELVAAAAQSAGTLVISALDGLGGIGKTALAVRAAHRIADRYPDGQLFIDLRGHAPGIEPVHAADALAYLLRALGVPPQGIPADVRRRSELYRNKLAGSRTLILLDNAADPAQVAPLLPDHPGCLVLITSRNRLSGLERARALTVDLLGLPESVDLLAKVAGPRRAPADSPAVRELAALCGHLPLALRIAAARLRHQDTLTVESLIAELRDDDRRLGVLSDGERDLRSVFESSFAALPEPERALLVQLGLASGPDIDAYGAANLAGVGLDTARRLLDALVERNLLNHPHPDRYSLHDLVRAYVRTVADRSGDEARAARERLLDYYQHVAWAGSLRQAGGVSWWPLPVPEAAGPTPELPDLASSLSWFRAERANLLSAQRDEATSPEHRIGLTAALAGYLLVDGTWPQAAAMHEEAARAAQQLGEPLAQAGALCNLSQILRQLGPARYEDAAEAAEQALRICRELEYRRGEADALYRLGQISYNQGRPSDTLATHRLALEIAQEVGDPLCEAQVRHALAQCLELLSQNAEARVQNGIAGRLYRELGFPHQEAFVLSSLSSLEITDGDLAAAAETARRSVAIGREHRHRQVMASALTKLGRVHTIQGDYDEADTVFRDALAIYEELDYETGQNMVLAYLGPSRTDAGDLEAALRYLERGFAVVGAEGAQLYTRMELMRELGFARYLAGDDEGVTLILDTLEAYRGPVDDEQGMAMTLNRLGTVALNRDEPNAALDRFTEAERLAAKVGMLIDRARALDGMARCHEVLGEREAARENLREAVALYRRMGAFELADAEKRLAAPGG